MTLICSGSARNRTLKTSQVPAVPRVDRDNRLTCFTSLSRRAFRRGSRFDELCLSRPSLSCPAVPHQDHLPPGRLFGGVSPAPGRSRTSRVCRSGSAPGNALSASRRLSLYVVSRRSPVRSSVMYQLKNSVGFGIACGARTTLPRIEARACRREGYRTSGRSHQSSCQARPDVVARWRVAPRSRG